MIVLCSRSWMPIAPNKVLCKCFSFCAVFGILVSAAAQNMRASSSVGQSWRLITAWSRVQVLAGPPQKSSDFRLRIFCLVAVQDSNRAALTTPVGRVSNQPSGLLLSPRFPTPRNVYQERCRQTIRSGDFFRGGRYRTRTARHRRRRGSRTGPAPANIYKTRNLFRANGSKRVPGF